MSFRWVDGYKSFLRELNDDDLEVRRGRNLDLMWSNSDDEARERYEAILWEQARRRRAAKEQG